MSVVLVTLAVLALLVAVNALYVAAEFAVVGARRTRVSELAESGSGLAKRLLPVLRDSAQLDRYIAACQVGITLSSLVLGFYGQARLTPTVGPLLAATFGLSEVAARSVTATVILVVLTILQVVLGELLPKSVALRYPERLALFTLLPLRWSLLLLRPFIAVLNGSALWLMRRFGVARVDEHAHVHSPDELEFLFRESARGGLIDAGEREMLENVLHIRTRLARQIMIPRTRMVTASVKEAPEDLLRRLVTSPHTRFPVVGASSDEILGMVHLKDLFTFARGSPGGDVRAITRELPLLPETVSVSELWDELRGRRAHMAALFDEYGGVAGLVTLEDIIEEVVGELQDEFDEETPAVRRTPDGRLHLRGDLLLSALNSRFLLDLPTEVDTIGGLVVARLEHLPQVGEELSVGEVTLRAEAIRESAVTEVSLVLPEDAEATGEEAA